MAKVELLTQPALHPSHLKVENGKIEIKIDPDANNFLGVNEHGLYFKKQMGIEPALRNDILRDQKRILWEGSMQKGSLPEGLFNWLEQNNSVNIMKVLVFADSDTKDLQSCQTWNLLHTRITGGVADVPPSKGYLYIGKNGPDDIVISDDGNQVTVEKIPDDIFLRRMMVL